MHRRMFERSRGALLASVVVALTMGEASRVHAQQATRVGFGITLGAGHVLFSNEWGGSEGSIFAELSASRALTSNVDARLSVSGHVMRGAAASIPGCVPGGACVSRSSPSSLVGLSGGFLARPGMSDVALVTSIGYYAAQGLEGPSAKTTAAADVGLEYSPQWWGRLSPSFTVRSVRFFSPLAGAKWAVLPGAGIVF
jgi:hypothetical protein